MLRHVPCFVLLILALTSRPCAAWNDTGHRLVALVAWEQLPQSSRDALAAAIRHHPRFAEDFAMPPDIRSADKARQDRWIFAHAATWPDIVKSFKGDLRATYNKSRWHWINLPLYLSDADRQELEPDLPTNTKTTWDPTVDDEGTLNVVQAIARFKQLLTTDGTPPEEKALDISWLLHIAGDIHQPLHSTALFTSRRFRNGDAGGNGIMIVGASDLHAVWDDLIADVETLAEHDALQERLQSDAQTVYQAGVAARTLAPLAWLYESHDLAREVVYNDLILETTAANEEVYDLSKSWREQPYLPEVKLSDPYTARAQRVARRRIVVAGYRLASLLRQVGY